ncbi:MAG: S41 family peptidase [Bacteroidota bacterium]
MRIVLVVVFNLFAIASNGQINTYLEDLAALKFVLQKTPSYKSQIKGDKQALFNSLYERLASDTTSNPHSFKYFYNLSQLIFPLKDNHLGFYQIAAYDNFKNKERIDSFIGTKEFLDYPTFHINIDSLKYVLAKRPADSVEGIYNYGRFYSVGLFKRVDKEYVGVIIDSDVNLWRKGQIAIHLYEYAPNLFKAIYGHPLSKKFILQTNEKYRNQSLVNSYFYSSYSLDIYSKRHRTVDYVNLSKNSSKFELKSINGNIQYLLLRSFHRNKITIQQSKNFYDSIKNVLTAKSLILDLRNNEGGATKENRKYLRLLKKFTRNGNLYVLLNNGTLSQAEIFTLQLKKLKNVTTVGQTTKGMLVYGSNYGKRERLPSGRFEIYPTDMKGNAKLLQYEDYGINPDIILRDDRDWIEQTVEIIRKK